MQMPNLASHTKLLVNLLKQSHHSAASPRLQMGQGSARYNSITTSEKRLVLDSWQPLRADLNAFGVNLFSYLINMHPHIAKYWPIGTEYSMKHFAEQFIDEFDRFVMHINRPTRLKMMLYNNAVNHAARDISVSDYVRLRKVILAVLGDRLSPGAHRNETLIAWSKVLTICFSFLTEMAEDYKDGTQISAVD